MIAYFNVEQRTEEWHKLRWGKVGGSLAKGLLQPSDVLLHTVLAELTESYSDNDEEEYLSAAMLRGIELEPVAINELSQYTGISFVPCGWMQSEVFGFLGISPDAVSKDLTKAAEIKCPGAKKHIETILTNDIPLDNIHQCVHYFTVNPNLQDFYFASFRPESIKPLFVKKLTRDSLVNLGTKARPVVKSVQEWVDISLKECENLQKQIDQSIEILKF